MMTLAQMDARHAADAAARREAAIAAYEAARLAIPAAVEARKAGDRDAFWRAASDLRDAERLVELLVDPQQLAGISARIVAEINAANAARG